MDERGNVVTTTYTSYQMIAGNLTKSLERVSEQPDVARETEYYLANIGNVKTIDEFFAVACEAYFVNRVRFQGEFPALVTLFDPFFLRR